MVKINELVARKGFDVLEADVVSVGDVRDVRNGELKVADAEIKDETGTTKLTLWNDEVTKVKAGDKVKITKGWTNEFQGNLSVSAGKFGTLEVEEGAASESAPTEAKEEVSEDVKMAMDQDII